MFSRTLGIIALTAAAIGTAQAGSVTLTIPVTQQLTSFPAPAAAGPTTAFPNIAGPTNVTTACAISSRCFSTYSNTSLTTIPFSLPYDYSAATNDIWAPNNAKGDTTMVMDLTGGTSVGTNGIFQAISVATIMNSIYATAGYNGVTITFSGVDNTASHNAISETVNLIAGFDYRGYYNVASNNGVADHGTVAGTTIAQGCALDASSTFAAANPGTAISVNVCNSIWAQNNGNGVNYYEDAQILNLGGLFANGYLDSITYVNHNGAAGTGNAQVNKAMLFAATVQTIPEPGSVVLMTSGFGALLFWKRRRKA